MTGLVATAWTSAGDTSPIRVPATSPVPIGERVAAVADVDKDGKLDLVVFMIDSRAGQNAGFYRVGKQLDVNGNVNTGELDSSAFEVDNSAPSIAVSSVRLDRGKTIITFDVKDDHSPIQRVEFSPDGQRWRGVFPVDGIADSREEHYDLAIDGELGDRGLTLRASDSMNNSATTHVDPPRRHALLLGH